MAANANDAVREQMLAYFYDRNTRANSLRGKRGAQARISDVKRDLKDLHGLNQPQVMSNLTYLLERGWVTRYEEHRSFTAPGGTIQPSTVEWYGVSANGIDKMEGDASEFTRKDPFAGVNITAVGSTVQLGDGNYVNAGHRELYADLEHLRESVLASAMLDDQGKVSAVVDIETAKMQLTRAEPDKDVLRSVWPSIQKIAVAAGLAANAAAIAARLHGWL